MSYYVEMLRAKRALVIAGIILGLFLVTTAIVRFSIHGNDVRSWPGELTGSPTAHVTQTKLADGTTRTVVDDPARSTHAIIVQGGKTLTMDITEPSTSNSRENHMSMGSMNLNETTYDGGKMRHVTMSYVPGVPSFDIGIFAVCTMIIGLLVATILGGVLSKENDGHLELAWTKPFSRDVYALGAFGVDIATIVLSQIVTGAVGLLITLMFFVPAFSAGPNSLAMVAIALLGPIAWFAIITAASASIKRGPGLVMGLGWVAAIMIPAIAASLQGLASINPVAAAFHAIFKTLSYLDPITYFSFNIRGNQVATGTGLPLMTSVAALAALALGYLALSVVQWRRVEA